MQYRVQGVDRTFDRIPRHALGITAALTVAAVAAKLAAERRRVAIAPMAWQDPAEAIRNAVVVWKGAIVPSPPPADPSPTLPLSRRELVEHEVDGGRPLHDLDHIQRQCRHADSLYGRCADCGTTWVEQARAMGGAR